MTLHIAVDARPLSITFSGIGRYLYQTLLGMIPLNNQVHWHLYADKPIDFPRSFGNVSFREGYDVALFKQGTFASLHSTAFSQLVFPVWCQLDKITVFWSPRHHLPLLLPRSIKKVVTIHDLVWLHHPETMRKGSYWQEKWLMPKAISSADTLICISQATAASLIDLNAECRDKAVVIPSETVRPMQQQSSDPLHDRPFILFVGTLEPRKNLRRLLVAYAELVNQGYLTDDLFIVGSNGWGNQKISALVSALKIDDKVTITGFVSDDALQRYYQQATLLIFPSLYEGFGLTALEAMRYGTPVLASKTSSLPEVVGKTAAIIDPLSITSIEQALLQFYQDESFRNALKQSAVVESVKFDNLDIAGALLKVLVV